MVGGVTSSAAPAPTSGAPEPGSHRVGTLHTIGGMGAGSVPPAALVRMLVRLKWTLWKRSFRKNIGKLIGTIFGGLYGIGALVGLTFALGAAALLIDGAGPDAFGLLVRGLGIVLVLAWLVVPLVAFGLDDTLDPRRFATLPRSARELQPGLFTAALVSLPSLFTVLGILLVTAAEVLWLVTSAVPSTAGLVGALVLLLPANLLGYALCMLLPRAILARSAVRQSSRKGRELGGILAMILMVGLLYGVSLIAQSIGSAISLDLLLEVVRDAVAVLAWTPLGAPFAVPVDIAEGHVLTGVARLVISAAVVVLMWLWWRSSLDKALRSALVGDSTSGSAKVTALVPRLARQDARGAALGRSLRYWRRDSRYLAAVGIMPVMLVFFTVMGVFSEPQRFLAIGAVVFISGMSSISICNEIGFDGPSGWVNITAGISGRDNLAGRILALAVLAVPFAVIASLAVPLVLGESWLIPLVLLGSLGAMMSAWGASCLIAVTLPYPTSPPGTNPLKDKSANSANALIATFVAMLGMWVPQLPAIGLAITGLVLDDSLLQLAAGIVSVVCGALALWLCLRGAARILDRRYVDLFQKVRAYL